MPALNFLHVLALASIAIVALSSAPPPVNALMADRAQVARHVHAHDAIARRKRDNSATGRCKPRPTPTPTSTPISSTPPPAPSSPSTSSSAPSSASTGGSSNTSGKKWCLAWAGDLSLSKFALSKVQYVYDWSADPPNGLDQTSLTFCPMLYGYNNADDFQRVVSSGSYNCVLGMNEPNEPRTPLSPQEAVGLWMKYINDLPVKRVSPACTDDDSGMQWYQEFFSICRSTPNCSVDAIAFHAYTPSADHAIGYATDLHNTYNLSVWITEFACTNFGPGAQPNMGQIWDYAGKMRSFIDSTPWIEGACPFGAERDLQGVAPGNSLIGSNDDPSALAYFYLDSY